MMLEAAQHGDNAFVTLTYSPENLPSDRSVCPREMQLFLKRLRKTSPKLRYFGCGEYGDTSRQPHYHLALFNHPTCHFGMSRYSKTSEYCCAACDNVAKAWGKGHVFLGTLNPQSMAYIAGYVTKKMTKKDHPDLEGRHPEFARMSLRPGIGHGMMFDLASTILEHNLERNLIDVPMVLQHGKYQYPLGRYLRRNLRKLIGRHPDTPRQALDAQKEKLRPLRETAYANSTPFRTAILEKSLGRRIQIQAKALRSKKVGNL